MNELREASVYRHPIQEVCCSPFVPNDTLSNTNNGKMKVLTGPNASGKSVYLKQVTQSSVRFQHIISLAFLFVIKVLKWCLFFYNILHWHLLIITLVKHWPPTVACFYDIPNWLKGSAIPRILLICYMPWPTSSSLMFAHDPYSLSPKVHVHNEFLICLHISSSTCYKHLSFMSILVEKCYPKIAWE